jgi:hypothetical protein
VVTNTYAPVARFSERKEEKRDKGERQRKGKKVTV